MSEKEFRWGRDTRKLPNAVETLYLASRRIELGPRIGYMTVDHVRLKVKPSEFQPVHFLAQQVDNDVLYADLIKELWGWRQTVPDQRFKFDLQARINEMRRKLPDDLASPRYGAIRTVEGGYRAVSEL